MKCRKNKNKMEYKICKKCKKAQKSTDNKCECNNNEFIDVDFNNKEFQSEFIKGCEMYFGGNFKK